MSDKKERYEAPAITGDLEFETQAMWCQDSFGHGKTPAGQHTDHSECGPVWLNKQGVASGVCYMNPDVRSS